MLLTVVCQTFLVLRTAFCTRHTRVAASFHPRWQFCIETLVSPFMTHSTSFMCSKYDFSAENGGHKTVIRCIPGFEFHPFHGSANEIERLMQSQFVVQTCPKAAVSLWILDMAFTHKLWYLLELQLERDFGQVIWYWNNALNDPFWFKYHSSLRRVFFLRLYSSKKNALHSEWNPDMTIGGVGVRLQL